MTLAVRWQRGSLDDIQLALVPVSKKSASVYKSVVILYKSIFRAAMESRIIDHIFGPFFICDCSTPYFGSLNKEQLERYTKQFQNPERFFRVGGEIKAVPYKPEKDHER